jgi:hypothetical protein
VSRRFTLALLFVAVGSATTAARSSAQVPFPRRAVAPSAWTSLSVGLLQVQTMYDPDSDSEWDFGNVVQFRATIERDLQRGTSLGLAVAYARAPLTYAGPDCPRCDAAAGLWQALALFRIGGGLGLHQVIEIGAGVTGFSSFRRERGGSLAPGTTIDPTFSIGYGLGYPLSPNTQFILLQEVALMIHERGDRPAGDESNMPRTWATRVGIRYGLGGWR